VDLQGLGYLISIFSVFLLGAVAWPRPEDPSWVLPALLAGMSTSILGMFLRYIAHRRQRREVKRAKAIAAQNS
jgi:membrane protein DedA with SNARE-associated domain